jgi:hypothetical protein
MISRRRLARSIALVAAAFALSSLTAGCGLGSSLSDGLKKSKIVKDDLKKELDVDANVSIAIMNGHTTVSVALDKAPAGDAKDVKDKVEQIVKRQVPEAEKVDLKF